MSLDLTLSPFSPFISSLVDRFAIREVICRECFTRQNSKTCVVDIVWTQVFLLHKPFLPHLFPCSPLSTATFASPATLSLGNITVPYAISACQTKNGLTTVQIVDFVA